MPPAGTGQEDDTPGIGLRDPCNHRKSSPVRPNPEEAENRTHRDSTPLLHISEIRPEALFISPPRNTFPDVKVVVSTLDTQDIYTINTLLDSGATASFIDVLTGSKVGL